MQRPHLYPTDKRHPLVLNCSAFFSHSATAEVDQMHYNTISKDEEVALKKQRREVKRAIFLEASLAKNRYHAE